jgi:hypothetical protein
LQPLVAVVGQNALASTSTSEPGHSGAPSIPYSLFLVLSPRPT